MSIRLSVTADDCGLTRAVNTETIRLHRAGLVTSASIMMNMPAAEEALQQFADYPQLELGVHLNLTHGSPVTVNKDPGNRITRNDGTFKDTVELFARSVFPSRKLKRAVIYELEAQIKRFVEIAGTPAHLTTHMHFQVVPSLREIVYELAEQFGIKWVRATQYRASIFPNDPIPNAPEENPPYPFIVPDYLTMVQFWQDKGPAALYESICSVDTGTLELIVHPDIPDDPDFPEYMRYDATQRAAEVRFLENLGTLLTANPAISITSMTHNIP